MGFYSRKPISLGGIRFDCSKPNGHLSIMNARFWLGIRSDGYYVHIGQSGASYKTVFAHKGSVHQSDPDARLKQSTLTQSEECFKPSMRHSVDQSILGDTTFQRLLGELNRKRVNPLFCPFALAFLPVAKFGVAISAILVLLVYLLIDRPRKATLLYYDIDLSTEHDIKNFYHSFNELIQCKSSWVISDSTSVANRKYNAGAPTNIKRKRIKITYKAPPMLITNIIVPSILIDHHRIYFLPDCVFIVSKISIRTIGYDQLVATQSNQKFIEDGIVPSDSRIVGETYQYVNLSGGPDHRFKYNRQLPVLLCSELQLQFSSIINTSIQFSAPDAGKHFCEALKQYTTKTFPV